MNLVSWNPIVNHFDIKEIDKWVRKNQQSYRSLVSLQVEKLIEHTRNVSLDQQKESSSTRALFVCNKWDQVPPEEAKEVKNYIIKKLTHCWPSLDADSQVIYMSSTNALKAQGLGVITDEFAGLMNGIKSMVLKSIEARLQTKWRYWMWDIIAPAGFWPRGQNPRRHPSIPRVYTYKKFQ